MAKNVETDMMNTSAMVGKKRAVSALLMQKYAKRQATGTQNRTSSPPTKNHEVTDHQPRQATVRGFGVVEGNTPGLT